MRLSGVPVLFLSLVIASSAPAQTPPAAATPKAPAEEGIPVTEPLVIKKCGVCHKADDKGNLSRISWERSTPEGWQMAIRRMVRLNGLSLTPEEGRKIVKYLSTNHGLAPEEAKPTMYIAEHRLIDEKEPNETVRGACMVCHPLGRPMTWRRSKEEWTLLGAMHSGYYPVAEFTAFRRFPAPPDAPPPPPGTDMRDPVDQALDYMAKTYPLQTPEWASWKARMRAPKLSGRWLVSGYEAGKGRIIGELSIEPGAAEDEFQTRTTLKYLASGQTVQRKGKSLVYAGYSWRGRNEAAGADSSAAKEMREVMWFAPDQAYAEGRWFWGSYEEFGIDVTLKPAGEGMMVISTSKTMLKAGSMGERLVVYGDRFPDGLTPTDIDLGPGVTVKKVTKTSPNELALDVDVAEKAPVGKRDVIIRRAVGPKLVAVYDKIDYLKVTPEAAISRLGGTTHPKGYQQFDCIAWNRGADGKPNTADDVELGPVDAEFKMEEFIAVYGDDDTQYVGTLTPKGLFTPNIEGPNPKRKFSRNNYGDVWVVATYKGATDKNGKPLTAKAHMVVTVPVYAKWDTPEVEK
jgi:quinohemoprotein amine dehydrogenase